MGREAGAPPPASRPPPPVQSHVLSRIAELLDLFLEAFARSSHEGFHVGGKGLGLRLRLREHPVLFCTHPPNLPPFTINICTLISLSCGASKPLLSPLPEVPAYAVVHHGEARSRCRLLARLEGWRGNPP